MSTPAVKLIFHTGECQHDDDPTLPFKLEVNLRPPEFMVVAFVGMHGGSEEIVARAETQAALEAFVQEHALDTHPRLRRLSITGPAGVVLQKKGRAG